MTGVDLCNSTALLPGANAFATASGAVTVFDHHLILSTHHAGVSTSSALASEPTVAV